MTPFDDPSIDDSVFYTRDDLPKADPDAVQAAYRAILGRHLLAVLRQTSGQTLEEVAQQRGVTKAAVHKAENRDLTDVKIGTLLDHIRAIGFPVDEDWLARSIVNALPVQNRAA